LRLLSTLGGHGRTLDYATRYLVEVPPGGEWGQAQIDEFIDDLLARTDCQVCFQLLQWLERSPDHAHTAYASLVGSVLESVDAGCMRHLASLPEVFSLEVREELYRTAFAVVRGSDDVDAIKDCVQHCPSLDPTEVAAELARIRCDVVHGHSDSSAEFVLLEFARRGDEVPVDVITATCLWIVDLPRLAAVVAQREKDIIAAWIQAVVDASRVPDIRKREFLESLLTKCIDRTDCDMERLIFMVPWSSVRFRLLREMFHRREGCDVYTANQRALALIGSIPLGVELAVISP